MKNAAFNYRHLHYFWVVAQEGSVTGAAQRLGVAVQTVSAQLSLLEQALGKTLLAPQGRRLVPTRPAGSATRTRYFCSASRWPTRWRKATPNKTCVWRWASPTPCRN
jgi:hypothetical protein